MSDDIKKIRMVNDLAIRCASPTCGAMLTWYSAEPRPVWCANHEPVSADHVAWLSAEEAACDEEGSGTCQSAITVGDVRDLLRSLAETRKALAAMDEARSMQNYSDGFNCPTCGDAVGHASHCLIATMPTPRPR